MAQNPACQSFIPMLSPFIDGELVPGDRQTVERHLSACKDCTGRVADLRAESGLVRLGMEMHADEADFTGFAQKVMARVTPERPPLMERLQLAVSEMFLYQRGALATAAAAVVVLVLGGLVFSRLGGSPEGYASERVIVETVTAGEAATVKPVVTQSESGNTIIWLVDQPNDRKTDKEDEDDEEEIRGSAPPPLQPPDAAQPPPTGGEL